MTITTKNILVIAISDHVEAMRVASGLTIYGHEVQLVFADRSIVVGIKACADVISV